MLLAMLSQVLYSMALTCSELLILMLLLQLQLLLLLLVWLNSKRCLYKQIFQTILSWKWKSLFLVGSSD